MAGRHMPNRDDAKWDPLKDLPGEAGGAGADGAGGTPREPAGSSGPDVSAAREARRAPDVGSERRPTRGDVPLELREKIKAYPGTLTYLDLIRKNKRDSVILMVAMIALGILLGAIIGGAVGPVYRGARTAVGDYSDTIRPAYDLSAPGPTPEQERRMDRAPARVLGLDPSVYQDFQALLPSILMGAGAAALVAVLGTMWSWSQGANAILRMAHAVPIRKEDDPELYNIVDEMRLAGGLPMPKVYIITDSAMNAFATGRDPKNGVVAVTAGLRAKLTRDELQGVIAHEMAHIRHYDIRFSMLMATMVGLIVFASDAFLRLQLYGGRYRRGRTSGGKGGGGAIFLLVIGLILAILAPLFARIIQMAYSRQREYLADAGAVELTRNPEGLASALRKLADDEEPEVDTANRGTAHMYIVNPLRKMRRSHQRVSSMFASHPPVQERVARLLALAR
jgi:heat shock protein HtpX